MATTCSILGPGIGIGGFKGASKGAVASGAALGAGARAGMRLGIAAGITAVHGRGAYYNEAKHLSWSARWRWDSDSEGSCTELSMMTKGQVGRGRVRWQRRVKGRAFEMGWE